MVLKGGDIRQFKYAGREFDVDGGSSVTLILPGLDLTNMAAGNGAHVATGKRRLAGLDGLGLYLDDANKDLEFLVNIQTAGQSKPYSITLVSGITYAGSGLPEGDGFGKVTDTGIGTLSIRGHRLEQI
jgi:hypothetical protein